MSNLKSILLVEDNLRDAELTMTALQDHGLANDVVHVRDGAEALDYLQRRGQFSERAPANPAVVFLDLKMPKVDGLDLLEKIKSDEALKAIPVVMLTSSREEADLVRSYKLGVNAYVVKPVDFQTFVVAVREIGGFWAVLNEPPPRKLASTQPQPRTRTSQG
jgi:CheY-like chemotaxis protein